MKFLLPTLLFFVSCISDESYKSIEKEIVLSAAKDKKYESSTAGNFVATALQKVNKLDIVLYPKDLIDPSKGAFYSSENTADILELYPQGTPDQFYIGTMKGKDLKKFIFARILEKYEAEIEVAGLSYHFMFRGGYPLTKSVKLENGGDIDPDRYYKTAISKQYFFSGETFPSYKFRNGIERIFKNTFVEVSARDAVLEYLSIEKKNVLLSTKRALVEHVGKEKTKKKTISQIQGVSHRSPYLGKVVTTTGIVTVVAGVEWYPGGREFIIQAKENDDDPRTSEAIHVYTDDQMLDVNVGDYIEITAEVFEEYNNTGLTRTQLRNISKLTRLATGSFLPAPVVIGLDGRKIPKEQLSTYIGNLNFKKALKLEDGIDFWESLESMRVQFQDLRVVGFRGGKESSDPFDKKDQLTLYVVPDGQRDMRSASYHGGILPRPNKHLWNPQILMMASGALSPFLNSENAYRIGDVLGGKIVGIINYSKNLFGDGEYGLVIPEDQPSLQNFNQLVPQDIVPVGKRPKTTIASNNSKLTVAVYNLKNLSVNDQVRIDDTGEMIRKNLKCPDILGLVEAQDDNGINIIGDSGAYTTIEKIVSAAGCDKNYKILNINPKLHSEGGQPGGNIQVAMVFDQDKLKFQYRGDRGPLEETTLSRLGDLRTNPGRVFPNDDAFKRTRRSIVAQFQYKQEDVYVIINHFNSKLGDSSHWGAVHPIVNKSEFRRAKLAYKINEFVGHIERKNPKANIIVMGDFNAYLNEGPMKILEGNILYNLMRNLPKNQRYTTNHNGNSQSLDYIFVNKNLKKKAPEFNVLHLNSDYMGRLSDHDPLISGFSF